MACGFKRTGCQGSHAYCVVMILDYSVTLIRNKMNKIMPIPCHLSTLKHKQIICFNKYCYKFLSNFFAFDTLTVKQQPLTNHV